MAVFNEPTKWQTSLVNSGDANVIPQSTSVGTGEASFEDGFPQITQVPIGAGGIAPDRKDFNGLFKILGDWIFFAQNGGVPSYNRSYDYVEGRIVLHTDKRIYLCIQPNDHTDPKAPTDSTYWAQISTGTQIPTGVMMPFGGSTVPEGYLLCNGSAISRSTYARLFEAIGTIYGAGDGETTFNLPDLRDRYIIGADTNALGTEIAEQLPNINGGLDSDYYGHLEAGPDATRRSGAITYIEKRISSGSVSSSASNVTSFILNAHNSNSIYIDSGKVYPASLALNFIIKT